MNLIGEYIDVKSNAIRDCRNAGISKERPFERDCRNGFSRILEVSFLRRLDFSERQSEGCSAHAPIGRIRLDLQREFAGLQPILSWHQECFALRSLHNESDVAIVSLKAHAVSNTVVPFYQKLANRDGDLIALEDDSVSK